MSPRPFLAALVISLAFAGAASAQQKPEATVYRLRYASAADAAAALTAYAEQNRLPVAVVAEPVSNTVMVAGEAAPLKRAVGVLAELDREPPMVLAQVLVMEVPVGFATDIGLEDGDRWVLTPREVRMFSAALRGAKGRGGVDILSRPQLQVMDNQTGYVQVGADGCDLTARLTPRVTEGGVLLRLEAQVATPTDRGANVQSIQTTETVPDGGTVVVRGPRTKTTDGEAREILTVVTVHRIAPSGR